MSGLTGQLNAGGYTGLTLYPVTGGKWQASLRITGDGWSVAVADTPAQAMADVLLLLQPVKIKVEDFF